MVSTVIGLFADSATADSVVKDLVDDGFPRDDIRVIPEGGIQPVPTATASVGGRSPGGRYHCGDDRRGDGRRQCRRVPDRDGHVREKAVYYSEAVRRAGTLVCVTVDKDKVNEAKTIIDSHGSLDINNQAAQWRRGGWQTPFADVEEGDVVVAQTTYVCEASTAEKMAL